MKVTKCFFNIDHEQKWLNDMSKKGYRFVSRSWFTYQFVPNQENEFYYYIDQRGGLKDNSDFIHYLHDLNITLVDKQWGFYYFETMEKNYAEYIYTDRKSKTFFYIRNILWLTFIGILNYSIINGANGPYIFNISIPRAANTIILCLVIISIVKYLSYIVTVQNPLS